MSESRYVVRFREQIISIAFKSRRDIVTSVHVCKVKSRGERDSTSATEV